ncbi:Putative uncharacterized protein [Moritella viscosa]|nr:Putative uncharacterized protein [Moritella viscosa]
MYAAFLISTKRPQTLCLKQQLATAPRSLNVIIARLVSVATKKLNDADNLQSRF